MEEFGIQHVRHSRQHHLEMQVKLMCCMMQGSNMLGCTPTLGPLAACPVGMLTRFWVTITTLSASMQLQ